MEFWEWFNSVLFPEVCIGFTVFIPSLAFVYISGRVLGVLKKDFTKNLIGVIASYSLAYYYTLVYTIPPPSTLELVWYVIFRGSISVLWYVFIGFRIYSRIDNLLDAKIAEDDEGERK